MTRIRPWLLLTFILSVAAFLRFWQISSIPPGFHLDESFEGLEAWKILSDPSYRPIFLTGNFGVPPLNAYANALMFAIFRLFAGEVGPTAMRVTAGCFGLLGILALYALANELQNTKYEIRNTKYETSKPLPPHSAFRIPHSLPLFAAAALAVMRWHLHFSRMGIEPIIVPLLWTGATWLLLRSWRTQSRLSAIGSGVILAASMYTYQGAWIIPFLMIPTVGVLLIGRSASQGDGTSRIANPKSRIANLFLTALVALLLVLPLGWFFWHNPDLLLLRPTQIAVGVDANAAKATIAQEIWATAKMFGPFGTPGDFDPRRNLPGQAALDLFLALPFYLGLAIALWKIRQPAYSIPLIGLVGLLLPGIFSEYAPHFHRILGAAAPVALLCGAGLDWLWRFFADRRRASLVLVRWLAVLLLLGGGITTVRDYFYRWAALPDLYYAFDVGLWEIGQWMAAQPQQTPIFLTPRTLEHPTLAFALATKGQHSPPITFDGRHIFPLTRAANASEQLYISIEEEDFRTRLLLPEIFPDAKVVKEWRDANDKVYATAWQRPANSQAVRQPQVALLATLGDGIRLVGYDVQPAELHPGEVLYLQLYWETDSIPQTDWTVFTHLIPADQPDGTPLAGHDSLPGAGSLPTRRWQAGWRILDEYQIPLPADLPAGEYGLRIGMYNAAGEHLPADGAAIHLGMVKVE